MGRILADRVLMEESANRQILFLVGLKSRVFGLKGFPQSSRGLHILATLRE